MKVEHLTYLQMKPFGAQEVEFEHSQEEQLTLDNMLQESLRHEAIVGAIARSMEHLHSFTNTITGW